MSQTDAAGISDDLRLAVEIARPFLTGAIAPYQTPDRRSVPGRDVLAEITDHLYTHWFTRAGRTPQVSSQQFEYPSLAARLRAAHAATNRFETGWIVIAIHRYGALTVERLGERLKVVPPDYANLTRLAVPARLGDSVAITTRCDYFDYEDGWWMSNGRVGAAPVAPMIRVYWNCPPEAVTTLIAQLTDVLERGEVPYTLKCPLVASLFGRVDGVVIYLSPNSFELLKPQLRDVYREIEPSLDEHIPPFTLRLGRGVAAAEDPSNGQSFGQSRCEAVAAALIRANQAGVNDDAGLASAITAGLQVHNISSERPYLASTSPPDLVTTW